jgi:hypothetical protein
MKKALFILLVISSFNLTAQNIDDCVCDGGEPMEVGARTEMYQLFDKEYNSTNYIWVAYYAFPEERCIPKDHSDVVWPKMKQAILKALHNDKTYKQLLASITDEEQKKVLRILSLGSTGGLGLKGAFSKKIRGDINYIYLKVDLEKFVTNYKKCNAKNKKDDLKNNSNANKIPGESIYLKKQREERERKSLEQKRINKELEAVKKQQQITKQTITSFDNLSKELDKQLKTTFNSWTKQSDFNKTISSLTEIESTSISSIIAEVKHKSSSINNQYSKRKEDKRREIEYQGQQYANKAKTQADVNLSKSITGLTQVLAQNSLEKQRREAQKELRREQKIAEKELEERFIAKVLPRFERYFKLALRAVFSNEEEYYLEHFNYNDCLIDNSYSILSSNNSCSKPTLKRPIGNPKPRAADFYNAYLRKKASTDKNMNKVAVLQLELAIDANPNNANWLYESVLVKDLNTYQKAAILKKAHALDSSNSEIKEAYELALEEAKILKGKETAYINQHIQSNSDYDWRLHSNLKGITIEDNIYFINQRGEEILKIENLELPSYYNLDRLSTRNIFYAHKQIQFGNGLARFGKVKDRKLLYGYMNTKGKVLIPAKYTDATQFSEGLAAVKDKETQLWGYINLEGNLIIPFQFSEASFFSEGLAAISHSSFPYGAYLNKEGQVAIEGKQNLINTFIISNPFINGTAVVQTRVASGLAWKSHEDKYGYILPSGKFLMKKKFVKAYNFNKRGYAIVGNARRYYIIDKSGKKQHKETFKEYPKFINGKAKVDTGGWFSYKYITIDETGKTIKE